MLTVHHAYLLVGNMEAAEVYLESLFGKLSGSPDYFPWQGAVFGIDEARDTSIRAMRRAFGERKIFFIAPERVTLEAQNALLKTFEEPIPDTHFFLLLRDDGTVIPTLRSRMRVVRVKHSVFDKGGEAQKFLKFSLKDRLNFAKKFVDAEKNLSKFLDELLLVTRDRRVYEMRLVSDQRGVSPRLILEHVAVVL